MIYDGERYVPSVPGLTKYEHLQRYFYAQRFASNKDVLDIASGEGYGSAILSQTAKSVVGVDVDESAVRWANDRYGSDKARFELGDILRLRFQDKYFDLIVCFETIEHVNEPHLAMAELSRVLKDDGVIIISTPDKLIYNSKEGVSNPFHRKELSKDDFERLCRQEFSNVAFLGQRTYQATVLASTCPKSGPKSLDFVDPNICEDRSGFLQLQDSTYLLSVCSHAELPPYTWRGSIAFDNSYEAQNEIDIIRKWAQSLRAERDSLIDRLSAENSYSERKDTFGPELTLTRIENVLAELNKIFAEMRRNVGIFTIPARKDDENVSGLAEVCKTLMQLQKDIDSDRHQNKFMSIEFAKIPTYLRSLENKIDLERRTQPAAPEYSRAFASISGMANQFMNMNLPNRFLLLNDRLDRLASSAQAPDVGLLMSKLAARGYSLSSLRAQPIYQPNRKPSRRGISIFGSAGPKNLTAYQDAIYSSGLLDLQWYSMQTGISVSLTAFCQDYFSRSASSRPSVNPLFDPIHYLNSNVDVAESGMDPFLHYISYGWREKRSPHKLFDISYYELQIKNAVGDAVDVEPLRHYICDGYKFAVSPHPIFDVKSYVENNPLILELGLNPLIYRVLLDEATNALV